jgi:hypothetical protein
MPDLCSSLDGIGAEQARILGVTHFDLHGDVSAAERAHRDHDADEGSAAVREAEADAEGRGRLRLSDDPDRGHAFEVPAAVGRKTGAPVTAPRWSFAAQHNPP